MNLNAKSAFVLLVALLCSGVCPGQDICQTVDYLNAEVEDPLVAIAEVESIMASHHPDSLTTPEWELLYYKQANSYFAAQQYRKSIRLGKQYIDWIQRVNYTYNIADYYNMLGANYYYLDQLDSAAQQFVLAASKLKEDGKDFYYAIVMNNIGVMYMGEEDYEKSLVYYKNTMKAFLEIGDSTYLPDVLGNIGYSHIQLSQADSANLYADAAIQVGERLQSYQGYFNGLMTKAEIYQLQGDSINNIEIYKRVYREASDQNNDNYKNRAAQALANNLNNEVVALRYAQEAYNYSKAKNQLLEEPFLLTLAHLLRKNNQGEQAYDLVIPRLYIKDSLLSVKYENQKMELFKKYETAEKERLILTQQNELTQRDLDINRLLLGLSLLLLLGLSLLGYVLYQKNKSERKQQEYDVRLAQLETMILKSQMNPHFIFNSLNSIRYLFMKDQKEKGIKYITKFAKLLRSTLHHGDEALVNLAEEIELTELFIDLEQLRFDDQFSYTAVQNGDDWQTVPIPPFVVQPLVENAFWHGLSQSNQKEKLLKISIAKHENRYTIEVTDNGVGYQASKPTTDSEVNKKKSYGLSIIQERFALLNRTQSTHYDLEVLDAAEYSTGTCVRITINQKK